MIVPTATRWNSYFDAVSQIIETPLPKLNELCTKLDLRCFSEKEFNFLKEYCKVLKPLARGLDILQGEDNCYYGTLLPTLETILKKTRAMKPDISMMTLGLAVCIDSSIKQHFNKFFESKDANIAPVNLPKFKLKLVEELAKKDQ